MTDTTHTPPADHAPASYSSGGLSAEKIVVWLLLLAAFGFWVPYMFMIDHGVLTGHY